MLAQLNTRQNQSNWLMLLGQALYVALLLAALMVYLCFFCPDIYTNLRAITFIYSIITLFFLIAIGLNYFVAQGLYLVPMMIVPILVLVFFDGRTALFTTGVLSLICAGVTSFALEFLFLQFCASTAAVFSLRESRDVPSCCVRRALWPSPIWWPMCRLVAYERLCQKGSRGAWLRYWQ